MASRWQRALAEDERQEQCWLSIQKELKDYNAPGIQLSVVGTLDNFRNGFRVDEGRQQPFLSGIYSHWSNVLLRAFHNRLLINLCNTVPDLLKELWSIALAYLGLADIPLLCSFPHDWSNTTTTMSICEYRHPTSLKLLTDKLLVMQELAVLTDAMKELSVPTDALADAIDELSARNDRISCFACSCCNRVAHVGFAPVFTCNSTDASNVHHLCALCATTRLSQQTPLPPLQQ